MSWTKCPWLGVRDCVSSSLNTQPLQPDIQVRQQLELVYQIIVFTKLTGSISSTLSFPHICAWRLWLKIFSISSVQFLQSVCLHPVLSCAYTFCTMCLSSFHHDDYACVLLCLILSTYSAASSSSLRNFLTDKFLSEEFHKNRLFTPPLVDITHFQLVSEQGTPLFCVILV